jgi:hypothetical protein
MDAGLKEKRFDIRKQRIVKILTKSAALFLVKIKSRDQILIGFREDLYLHATRRRISFFARSQSIYEVLPDATRAFRSIKAALCHLGDSKASELRLRSSQSASMTRSFSGTVISCKGKVTDMK